MRYLILCAAVSWANTSYADVRIRVDLTLSSYRVRPNPGPKTSHSSIDMVMHSDTALLMINTPGGGRTRSRFKIKGN
jgi:hypothetical protein